MEIKTKFNIGDQVFCLYLPNPYQPDCSVCVDAMLYKCNIEGVDVSIRQTFDCNQGGMINVKEEVYTIIVRNVPDRGDVHAKRPDHLLFGSVEEAVKYLTKNIQ